uniref:Uncharacterized protein n=1 Tax=Arundo donax TaxID=35708 RepID=A0A0A9BMA7_ARUDO
MAGCAYRIVIVIPIICIKHPEIFSLAFYSRSKILNL